MEQNCKNCVRRVETDKDYMDNLDCYGRKIDFNCLVTDEELQKEYGLSCKSFVDKEEESE